MMTRFPDATSRTNDTVHQDEIYSSMNRINFSATVSGAPIHGAFLRSAECDYLLMRRYKPAV